MWSGAARKPILPKPKLDDLSIWLSSLHGYWIATNNDSCSDLPPVKPSAIALGTIFNHTVELAGKSYHRNPLFLRQTQFHLHNRPPTCSSHPGLRPDLPARQVRRHQGGVHPFQGGHLRRCRLGHLTRRLGPAVVRRRRPHQCHRHPELQGSRLPRRSDLCGHERPYREFSYLSLPVLFPPVPHIAQNANCCLFPSSLPSSSPRSGQSRTSASAPSPSCSRPSACPWSSPTGALAPTRLTRKPAPIVFSQAGLVKTNIFVQY